jgi:hypothetical protein
MALTFVTLGLWSISWAALCIGKLLRPWRCEHCGWHIPEFNRNNMAPKPARIVRLHPAGNPGSLLPVDSSRLRP